MPVRRVPVTVDTVEKRSDPKIEATVATLSPSSISGEKQ